MAIYSDSLSDYTRHPARLEFERIREKGDSSELEAMVQQFISKGHDPNDPNDAMYKILGITPDLLGFLQHEIEERSRRKANAHFAKAAPDVPSSANSHGHRHGKNKGHRLSPEPEDG